MKKAIHFLLSFILKLYPYRLNLFLTREMNFIYSCWVKNAFKQVGNKTRFQRPLYMRGGGNIRIGDNCLFYRFCEINAWDIYKGHIYHPELVIGNDCQFGPYNHITCCNSIKIGNGVLTGMNVIISDNNHGSLSVDDLDLMPKMRKLTSKGEVVIGNNVWIGDKVAILSGVHIGDGVVIAANAVVTKDIPPYSLVAGVPGKIIKKVDLNR